MNFHSLQYYLFLPAAALLCRVLPGKYRNPVLLALSYYFYMCWRPAYALLILLSTAITYICGGLIRRAWLGRRRLWAGAALVLNLGLLFWFKYARAGLDALAAGLDALGLAVSAPEMDILLPVGISFYTFQALSYTLDVYRGRAEEEPGFLDYALFVSFFPQLVAGPIERSGALLPQLRDNKRPTPEQVHTGAVLILWGLYKKLVIGDRLAELVDAVYGASAGEVSGAGYAVATLAFAVQIYCDFSAYSDIAVGSAKLFGVDLMRNFRGPYLATSLTDFWRRWHVSLSGWFRDYLYIPLGGSRGGRLRTCRNLLIVFGVSGLWHGAAGHYVVWGLFNGACLAVGTLTGPVRETIRRGLGRWAENPVAGLLRWGFTLLLVCLGWVLFRAESMGQALEIYRAVFTGWGGVALLDTPGVEAAHLTVLALGSLLLLAVDAAALGGNLAGRVARLPVGRYVVYFVLIAAALIFGRYGNGYSAQAFMYFQF